MAAGIGHVQGTLTESVPGMFYPYSPNLSSPNLSDTSWTHWMDRDSTGHIKYVQLINQSINNYEGYTFIDTAAIHYHLLPTDTCVGTVPQPHNEFIAVLSMGGEEIDMNNPTPHRSNYSNIDYQTIFDEPKKTPIRTTYTYYAPLPNPMQFEYLTNTFIIKDTLGNTLQKLPEKGKADLTFNIEKGEIVGFLGPNGAGKTTTMRILTGYMPPSSGKVEIGGFDVIENSLEVRRIVGYMPETVPLYTEMTVFDYLKFYADLRKIKDGDDRVDEVLEMVHLEDRSEGYISKLSKGMRQRVGLAQAMLHKPEVLILDEPTIGLDPAQIIEVRKLIQEIGKDHTVLLSTHILPEAQQVCTRVLILNKGRLVAEDTPERLQSRLIGAQRIGLKIRGDITEVIPLVAATPGVINVSPKNDDSLEFESSPGEDARPFVARAVVQAGFDLLELQPSSLSLEEIFLELTRDEPVPLSMSCMMVM